MSPKPSPDAPKVTWAQTRALRLARLRLSDPLGARSLRKVVRELGGVHAQVSSAGEMQIALRARGIKPGSVEKALWKDRTLAKTWMMRGTLHWIDAEDLGTWAAASETRNQWRKPAWLKFTGLKVEEVEAAIAAVAEVLSDEPKTREEVADAVHRKLRSATIDEYLRSGWGSLLKLVSAEGKLCFGPTAGRNVTFVAPEAWLAEWHMPGVEDAMEEVCLRYLASHAPATREEFARWWGYQPADASRVIKRLAERIVEVDREGAVAYVVKKDLSALMSAEEDDEVRMLPMFDAYTLSGLPHDAVVPKKRKNDVFRKGAWVSQTVLRGGRVVGVWEHERKPRGTTVQVRLFQPRAATKKRLSGEVEILEPFIGPLARLSIGSS